MGEIKTSIEINNDGEIVSRSCEIKYDKHNYRKHDERNLNLIKKSLKECGAGRSILIDADGEIIAGNATYKTAQEANIPVKIIKTDGKELIALQRTDLSTQDKKRKQLALMDNTTSDKPNWDIDTISADFDLSELPALGLEDLETLESAESDFPDLPEGDGSGFEQMTFTLSNRQAQIVKDALAKAKNSNAYKYLNQEENSNSNGNALFCVMEGYLQ